MTMVKTRIPLQLGLSVHALRVAELQKAKISGGKWTPISFRWWVNMVVIWQALAGKSESCIRYISAQLMNILQMCQ
jgi:hypothetical protein